MDDYITPTEPVQAVAARRANGAPWTRIGLLGIGAAALIAVALLAFGSTAAPAGTLAAGAGTDAAPLVVDLNGGPGGPGRGGPGHGPGGITVTAISGSSISLETADGWTRTITVDSGTTYSKSGDTIALGDLAVGDQVAFRQTLEDDGSWTIDSVAVILPHVGGEVTAVSGSTITVKDREGTSVTIKVDGDTEYQVNGDNAALSDVKVGMFLVAEGTKNSDGSLNATDVHAGEAGMHGPGGHGPRMFPGPNGSWGEKPSATDSAS